MDGSRFDAWTRRRFGLATGGLAASFLGLATVDELEAKRKRNRKKRKRRQKKGPHICAGRNSCQTEGACHRGSSDVQCFCFVTAEGGKPFCSIGMVLTNDCSTCAKGQTCVDASGGRCGSFQFGCAEPCPSPKRR